MNAIIAQFLVWVRLVFSPRIVMAAWNAIQDGEITSQELGDVISAANFKIKVPFVTNFKTV